MTRPELIDLLVDLGWMWADHEENGIKGIAFKKEFNGSDVKYHMSDVGVEKTDIENLKKKLMSHDVVQMTRIVGYYSRVSNWNKSKLGELADRRTGQKQGTYGV